MDRGQELLGAPAFSCGCERPTPSQYGPDRIRSRRIDAARRARFDPHPYINTVEYCATASEHVGESFAFLAPPTAGDLNDEASAILVRMLAAVA